MRQALHPMCWRVTEGAPWAPPGPRYFHINVAGRWVCPPCTDPAHRELKREERERVEPYSPARQPFRSALEGGCVQLFKKSLNGCHKEQQ